VIVVLAGFGVWSAQMTSHVAERSADANRLSDAFHRAQSAIEHEEVLARRYRLQPSATVRARFSKAARELKVALLVVTRTGSARDRELATYLLATQRGYLLDASRMFSAVDAGETAVVRQIASQYGLPWFAAIDGRVDAATSSHRTAALTSLNALAASARFELVATPIAFALAIVLVGLLTLQLGQVFRQLRRQAEAANQSALHDPLTGLPNYRMFFNSLEEEIAAARRDSLPVSMLMIDLDRFKEINDTLGHTMGDRLLRGIGPRLGAESAPGAMIARLGGDEFAVVLPAVGAREAAETASRFRVALQAPFEIADLTLVVDASIGIASFPIDGADAGTLVQHSDVAMYVAKRGRHGIASYDPAIDPYTPQRLKLLGELRHALESDQLELHYQPKFNTNDLSAAGVEALIRWRHPTRGMLAPGEFIGLAEHTSLMKPLTYLVLRKASRQWRTWKEAGLDLPIAVNLSAANLLDNDLIGDVARILREEAMPADRLGIEITESVVMSDPAHAIEQLAGLAASGIKLSIDDFGTGHSSLAYLRRLPVRELKIDRSFIQQLSRSQADASIVRSTIDLAHSLGLRVVAEGLEDGASLAALRHFKCDEVQGYHLCRPTPPEFLAARLAKHIRPGHSVEQAEDIPRAA
jgi:diguanylate cyclase (GGDEF)-like protein